MQIAPFDQCCADCNHRLDVQKGYDILLEALMNMLEARWTGGSWDEAYEPHDHRKVNVFCRLRWLWISIINVGFIFWSSAILLDVVMQ